MARIKTHQPEIVCLTESAPDLLSGNTICSQPDYGYKIRRGRKVVLWSANPWQQVDDLGDQLLPPGRFVSGQTETSIGPIRVIGVCIPWFGSRAGSGIGRWQDHADYLAGLGPLIDRYPDQPLILVGDFNQQIAPGYAPANMLAKLKAATKQLTIETAGLKHGDRLAIDHIATAELRAEKLQTIDNYQDDKRLSDHFGIVADLKC